LESDTEKKNVEEHQGKVTKKKAKSSGGLGASRKVNGGMRAALSLSNKN